jgi:acyl-CoA thioesterase-1
MLRRQHVHRFFLPVLVVLSCQAAVAKDSSETADVRPRIVAFGDSLTAGLGVSRDDAYPAQLQVRLDGLDFRYRVINAGVSGDTTAGGLRRVPWVLNNKPDLVILELGGNDGLRGLSLEQTKSNLSLIIQQLQQAGVTVILAGMKLPPNYGQEYIRGFEEIYPALARQYRLPLIPFFLEDVAASSALNQPDGIHPTKEGYRIVVEQVLKVLKPILHGRATRPQGAPQAQLKAPPPSRNQRGARP